MINADRLNRYREPLLATLAIAIVSLATMLTHLDTQISHLFFNVQDRFYLKGSSLEQLIYQSINLAVLLTALCCLGYLIARVFFKRGQRHHRLMLALFFSMLIGPGIIVNSLLKDNWGRPRPIQTQEFGGQYQPKALLEFNWGNKGSSFPSGHASVPFAFLVLAFAARRRGKSELAAKITTGLSCWFVAVALARIAAGGHHFSDVMWGGYISFMIAWLCSYKLLEPAQAEDLTHKKTAPGDAVFVTGLNSEIKLQQQRSV